MPLHLTAQSESTETLTAFTEEAYSEVGYTLYPGSTTFPGPTTFPGDSLTITPGARLTPVSEGTETLTPLTED